MPYPAQLDVTFSGTRPVRGLPVGASTPVCSGGGTAFNEGLTGGASGRGVVPFGCPCEGRLRRVLLPPGCEGGGSASVGLGGNLTGLRLVLGVANLAVKGRVRRGTLSSNAEAVVPGPYPGRVTFPTYDEIRELPLPQLSLKLLKGLSAEQANFNSFIRGFEQQGGYGEPGPADMPALLARVSDAWAWLEAHALIGPSAQNPQTGNWQRRTALGHAAAADPKAVEKIWAEDRLAGDLHPSLASARTNFALGDYETASFAAMKAVEVEVRRVGGLPNEVLGVPLMRKAFSPKDGVLTDPDAEGGEQQATADLFAGAIGAFKNPASHRTVMFEDPVEAAEVVQLADLLLRIVKRAEARLNG